VTDDSLVQCIGDVRERWAMSPTRSSDASPPRLRIRADVSGRPLDQPAQARPRPPGGFVCRTLDGVNTRGGLGRSRHAAGESATYLCHLEYEWQNPIRAPLLEFFLPIAIASFDTTVAVLVFLIATCPNSPSRVQRES